MVLKLNYSDFLLPKILAKHQIVKPKINPQLANKKIHPPKVKP